MLYAGWMRLSIRLGQLPQDVMRGTTWRWYRTWLEWEKQRWQYPGKTEYLMDGVEPMLARIAQRVQQGWVKNPGQVRLDHQFVEYKSKRVGGEKPMSRKEAAKRSKSVWVGMLEAMGGKITRKRRRKSRGK